jgi:hypothetical protein
MPNITRIPFIEKKGDKETVIQPTQSRPAGNLSDKVDEVQDWGGLNNNGDEDE